MFCNDDLGRNEAIEHFQVGRRLAFDEAKGRLWVVCRKCERWNLTPLDERWEAIEECEREFRATKMRVSTDQIGLARLKEGLELVRIGAPMRSEMAAWRYGDQFGRRRQKQVLVVGGAAAAVGAVILAGPVMGLVGISGGAVWQVANGMRSLYRATTRVRVSLPDNGHGFADLNALSRAQLYNDSRHIVLRVQVKPTKSLGPRWGSAGARWVDLHDDDALRAAATVLPMINRSGGGRGDVQDAVSRIEHAGDPLTLFRRETMTPRKPSSLGVFFLQKQDPYQLSRMPISSRLALEMMVHEESERRALEGELHILEDAWRSAEEIAAIADDMFVPDSVNAEIARLKEKNR